MLHCTTAIARYIHDTRGRGRWLVIISVNSLSEESSSRGFYIASTGNSTSRDVQEHLELHQHRWETIKYVYSTCAVVTVAELNSLWDTSLSKGVLLRYKFVVVFILKLSEKFRIQTNAIWILDNNEREENIVKQNNN